MQLPVRMCRDPTDTSCCRVEPSLTRAPLGAVQGPRRCLECHANSILVVDKVRRAGAVPSVSIMRRRCCFAVVFLWYSKGAAVSYIIGEQRAWLWGWGEEVGPSCPRHTLQPPTQVLSAGGGSGTQLEVDFTIISGRRFLRATNPIRHVLKRPQGSVPERVQEQLE